MTSCAILLPDRMLPVGIAYPYHSIPVAIESDVDNIRTVMKLKQILGEIRADSIAEDWLFVEERVVCYSPITGNGNVHEACHAAYQPNPSHPARRTRCLQPARPAIGRRRRKRDGRVRCVWLANQPRRTRSNDGRNGNGVGHCISTSYTSSFSGGRRVLMATKSLSEIMPRRHQ